MSQFSRNFPAISPQFSRNFSQLVSTPPTAIPLPPLYGGVGGRRRTCPTPAMSMGAGHGGTGRVV